jgi:hypothetical protein
LGVRFSLLWSVQVDRSKRKPGLPEEGGPTSKVTGQVDRPRTKPCLPEEEGPTSKVRGLYHTSDSLPYHFYEKHLWSKVRGLYHTSDSLPYHFYKKHLWSKARGLYHTSDSLPYHFTGFLCYGLSRLTDQRENLVLQKKKAPFQKSQGGHTGLGCEVFFVMACPG